VCNC